MEVDDDDDDNHDDNERRSWSLVLILDWILYYRTVLACVL